MAQGQGWIEWFGWVLGRIFGSKESDKCKTCGKSVDVAGNQLCSDCTGTSQAQDQTCIFPGCTKQKFNDGIKTHDFCSKAHADLYSRQQHTNSETTAPTCKTPGCTRPRYKKNGTEYYDFCSRSCRDSKRQPALEPSQRGRCSLPGCTDFKYQDPSNGRIHEFCSRGHAFKASEHDLTIILRKATPEEAKYVTSKFDQKWAPTKSTCPPPIHVYSIYNAKLKEAWTDYRNTLSDDTIEPYFHGTKLECNITSIESLCHNEHCGVCGIAKTGFDRRCIKKNINFQRFGHGFYLAPNSSKCHDYTQGKNGYRAMLLFDVCPGNKYLLKCDDETLTAPPQGYNSVHGKAGISLNYDELVIYNPDAALPKFIIVYQRDGIEKIAK